MGRRGRLGPHRLLERQGLQLGVQHLGQTWEGGGPRWRRSGGREKGGFSHFDPLSQACILLHKVLVWELTQPPKRLCIKKALQIKE